MRAQIKFNTTSGGEVADGVIYVNLDGLVYMNATGLFNRNVENGPFDRFRYFGQSQSNYSGMTARYSNIRVSTGDFI